MLLTVGGVAGVGQIAASEAVGIGIRIGRVVQLVLQVLIRHHVVSSPGVTGSSGRCLRTTASIAALFSDRVRRIAHPCRARGWRRPGRSDASRSRGVDPRGSTPVPHCRAWPRRRRGTVTCAAERRSIGDENLAGQGIPLGHASRRCPRRATGVQVPAASRHRPPVLHHSFTRRKAARSRVGIALHGDQVGEQSRLDAADAAGPDGTTRVAGGGRDARRGRASCR